MKVKGPCKLACKGLFTFMTIGRSPHLLENAKRFSADVARLAGMFLRKTSLQKFTLLAILQVREVWRFKEVRA